ncbi:uncharacterized, partial [Tachysurus ichikawai]
PRGDAKRDGGHVEMHHGGFNGHRGRLRARHCQEGPRSANRPSSHRRFPDRNATWALFCLGVRQFCDGSCALT